jgi:hypothetical protein
MFNRSYRMYSTSFPSGSKSRSLVHILFIPCANVVKVTTDNEVHTKATHTRCLANFGSVDCPPLNDAFSALENGQLVSVRQSRPP